MGGFEKNNHLERGKFEWCKHFILVCALALVHVIRFVTRTHQSFNVQRRRRLVLESNEWKDPKLSMWPGG